MQPVEVGQIWDDIRNPDEITRIRIDKIQFMNCGREFVAKNEACEICSLISCTCVFSMAKNFIFRHLGKKIDFPLDFFNQTKILIYSFVPECYFVLCKNNLNSSSKDWECPGCRGRSL